MRFSDFKEIFEKADRAAPHSQKKAKIQTFCRIDRSYKKIHVEKGLINQGELNEKKRFNVDGFLPYINAGNGKRRENEQT